MNEVLILGGFSEVIELCQEEGIKIIGIIDKKDQIVVGDEVYTSLYDDTTFLSKIHEFEGKNIIITPDKPSSRRHIYTSYINSLLVFCNVISKTATLAASIKMGKGNIVQKLVNISSNVVIGDFVKINVGANIMHDNIIGNFVTIAPNVVLLGRVKIEDGAYIGANATILPNIKVGRNAVVGAGAVVTKNVLDNSVVKGVPAV